MLGSKARRDPKRVVFAEADNVKILNTAQIVFDEQVAYPILLGNERKIRSIAEENGIDLEGLPIIDPQTEEYDEKRQLFSELFFRKRRFTQFSRVGLTYQITATSISDPPVNESLDPAQRIPVIYAIPNILTSRITGTFVYDTRQPAANGIDTVGGSQLSMSL